MKFHGLGVAFRYVKCWLAVYSGKLRSGGMEHGVGLQFVWTDGDKNHGCRLVINDELPHAIDGECIDTTMDFFECDDAVEQVHVARE
jgi:hypothetical protein